VGEVKGGEPGTVWDEGGEPGMVGDDGEASQAWWGLKNGVDS